VLLSFAEGLEHGDGERLRARLELVPLALAARRQRRPADSPVRGVGADDDKPVRLERPQEPAEIAGVVPEPFAEIADVRSVAPDLPEEAGLAERPLAPEELFAERACSLGRDPVEPPHLCYSRCLHSLTRVRNITRNGCRQVPRMS
jgi:hypothetical protein